MHASHIASIVVTYHWLARTKLCWDAELVERGSEFISGRLIRSMHGIALGISCIVMPLRPLEGLSRSSVIA